MMMKKEVQENELVGDEIIDSGYADYDQESKDLLRMFDEVVLVFINHHSSWSCIVAPILPASLAQPLLAAFFVIACWLTALLAIRRFAVSAVFR